MAYQDVSIPAQEGAESVIWKEWARPVKSGVAFRRGDPLGQYEIRAPDGSVRVQTLSAPFDLRVESVEVQPGQPCRSGEAVMRVETTAAGPASQPGAVHLNHVSTRPLGRDGAASRKLALTDTVIPRAHAARDGAAGDSSARRIEAGQVIRSDSLGELRIESPVGEGASGAVYRCVPERGDQEYALKVFHDVSECDREWSACELIRRRCSTDDIEDLVLLEHRESSDRRMAWMKFQPRSYRTLDQEIESRKRERDHPGRAEVLAFIKRAALAALPLHSRNLCHLDLKPRNLMVRIHRHGGLQEVAGVRLLDFTLCTEDGLPFGLSDDRSVQLAGGTVHYLPLRFFKDHHGARAGRWMDVYSIAIMAYEYACFKVPQDNHHTKISEVLQDPKCHGLDELLQRCWTEQVADCDALLAEVKALEDAASSIPGVAGKQKPGTKASATTGDRPIAGVLFGDGRNKLQQGLVEEARRCFEQAGIEGDMRGWASLAESLWREDHGRAMKACEDGEAMFKAAVARRAGDSEALMHLRVVKALIERDHGRLADLCPSDDGSTDWLRTGRRYARLLQSFDVLEDAPPKSHTTVGRREAIASGFPWKIRHRVSGISLLLVSPSVRSRGSGSAAFYLGESVVSQAEWRAAGVPLPEGIVHVSDDLPIHGVSWFEASEFARAIGFRLPTGDEWDLAAWGDDPTREVIGIGPRNANVRLGTLDTRGAGMVATAALEPLPSGFRQMFGNIWEWCQDSESSDSVNRLRRGGCYKSSLEDCIDRRRSYFDGSRKAYSLIGFRVALSP
jgi:hypothetical protein